MNDTVCRILYRMMGGPLECSIHTLDINHNDIHSMTTLQHLFQALPSLSSLLCLYTPLYNQYEDTLLIREVFCVFTIERED